MDRHGVTSLSSFKVLGVRVHAVEMSQALETIGQWVSCGRQSHCVVAATTHMLTECVRDSSLRRIINGVDLVMPDGMPLVKEGRRQGHKLQRRCTGPELLLKLLDYGRARGLRHFFYGDTQAVLDSLVTRLQEESPEVQVAGTHSPPFRTLTPEEEERDIEMLNASDAHVLWVALGCPKQEKWVHRHLDRLNIPVIVAVGQGVRIASGVKPEVPGFLGDKGFEWLFRLCLEPRRTWRRVLIRGPEFYYHLALQRLGLRSYGSK